MQGRPAQPLGLFRWNILLPRVYALQVKGPLLSRRLMPCLPREKAITAVLALSYFRFAFQGEMWGKNGTRGMEGDLRVASARAHLHQELFSPKKNSACSLFSVKPQLVCSVNKASELIGGLKKLGGKALP